MTMIGSAHITTTQLLERLSGGFTALLKQVDELKCHNQAMEKLLDENNKISEAFIGSEQKAQDLAISDGIEALDALKRGELNASQENYMENASESHRKIPMPNGHPLIHHGKLQKMSCPFASMANQQPIEQEPFRMATPTTQRPNSLPTPPGTREQYIDDAKAGPSLPNESMIPAAPPSATGSISKCPIRLLDERPPEEIAEYVDTHKHEIPRSHEICVKRYQNNEQSIRQLDAKYGNLVSMIQSLGVKHQPILHHKDEAEEREDEWEEGREHQHVANSEYGKSGGDNKVEDWVGDIPPPQSGDAAEIVSNEGGVADRGRVQDREEKSHFDRPLKEIRVGESPNRPWGISVPPEAPHQLGDIRSGQKYGAPKPDPRSTTKPDRIDLGIPPKDSAGGNSDQDRDHPIAVFNGPVFIGYPPEQAAEFLKRIGTLK